MVNNSCAVMCQICGKVYNPSTDVHVHQSDSSIIDKRVWISTNNAECKPKYEIFCNHSYYDLWCVRRVGVKDFNSGWHFTYESDAKEFKRLLEISK